MDAPQTTNIADITAPFSDRSLQDNINRIYDLPRWQEFNRALVSSDIDVATTITSEAAMFKADDYKESYRQWHPYVQYPFDKTALIENQQFHVSYYDGSEENPINNVTENLIGTPLGASPFDDPRHIYVDTLLKHREYAGNNDPLDTDYLKQLYMLNTDKGTNYYKLQVQKQNEAINNYARAKTIRQSEPIDTIHFTARVARGITEHDLPKDRIPMKLFTAVAENNYRKKRFEKYIARNKKASKINYELRAGIYRDADDGRPDEETRASTNQSRPRSVISSGETYESNLANSYSLRTGTNTERENDIAIVNELGTIMENWDASTVSSHILSGGYNRDDYEQQYEALDDPTIYSWQEEKNNEYGNPAAIPLEIVNQEIHDFTSPMPRSSLSISSGKSRRSSKSQKSYDTVGPFGNSFHFNREGVHTYNDPQTIRNNMSALSSIAGDGSIRSLKSSSTSHHSNRTPISSRPTVQDQIISPVHEQPGIGIFNVENRPNSSSIHYESKDEDDDANSRHTTKMKQTDSQSVNSRQTTKMNRTDSHSTSSRQTAIMSRSKVEDEESINTRIEKRKIKILEDFANYGIMPTEASRAAALRKAQIEILGDQGAQKNNVLITPEKTVTTNRLELGSTPRVPNMIGTTSSPLPTNLQITPDVTNTPSRKSTPERLRGEINENRQHTPSRKSTPERLRGEISENRQHSRQRLAGVGPDSRRPKKRQARKVKSKDEGYTASSAFTRTWDGI